MNAGRIAVIGSGISGLSAAWLLNRDHRVSVFEANDYPGGHSHTVDVSVGGREFAVDTGFIVYNPTNYPNLTALFDLLGVHTSPSNMSFAVSLDQGRFEYAGGTPLGLVARLANLVSPPFWRMLAGIVRFYHNSTRYGHDAKFADLTLGELLARQGYSRDFIERHLAPMGAAIWSSDCDSILDFPAQPFIRFFDNHGLTRFVGRPGWRTVTGGSRRYVDRLISDLREPVQLSTPVTAVTRGQRNATLRFGDGHEEVFDQVVFACHADQALALMTNPDAAQARALSNLRYCDNRVVLHTDTSLMPSRRLAWASWNFIQGTGQQCMVSYWMNRLQPLPVTQPVIITLNPQRPVDPDLVLGQFDYAHPVMDSSALSARQQVWQLQGRGNTWFCGAWLGDGFHEDGIQSGLAVAEMLGGHPRPWYIPGQNRRIGLEDMLLSRQELAA